MAILPLDGDPLADDLVQRVRPHGCGVMGQALGERRLPGGPRRVAVSRQRRSMVETDFHAAATGLHLAAVYGAYVGQQQREELQGAGTNLGPAGNCRERGCDRRVADRQHPPTGQLRGETVGHGEADRRLELSLLAIDAPGRLLRGIGIRKAEVDGPPEPLFGIAMREHRAPPPIPNGLVACSESASNTQGFVCGTSRATPNPAAVPLDTSTHAEHSAPHAATSR